MSIQIILNLDGCSWIAYADNNCSSTSLQQEMADQARLLHQDKMMSLGRLAASVAHEIVVLRVTDTGCGIREEEMRHIFEPFYTTKQAGYEHRSGAVHHLRHHRPAWRQSVGHQLIERDCREVFTGVPCTVACVQKHAETAGEVAPDLEVTDEQIDAT